MPIYLNAQDEQTRAFARATFPSYSGRKFALEVRESVTLDGTYWFGGSRSSYAAFTVTEPCMAAQLPHFNPPQFGGPQTPPVVALRPGYAIAEHVLFRGKDLGLRFYLHPADAAPLLPAPADSTLSDEEAFVLCVTGCLKSAGRPRERERIGMSLATWDACLAVLESRGLIARRGITPEGRNVMQGERERVRKMGAWV